MRVFSAIAVPLLLAACQAGEDGPATGPTHAFDGIAPDETVYLTGTEPFWAGEIDGLQAFYSTPENQDGSRFRVERFAGNNGLSFSGDLDGSSFDLTVTPGECSDGMSDRTYPFTATLVIADGQRQGCAWTDVQPFTGPENP